MTYSDSSLARKSATLATSAGVPKRPQGISVRASLRAVGLSRTDWLMGVAMMLLGAILLTLILYGASLHGEAHASCGWHLYKRNRRCTRERECPREPRR